MRHWISTAVMLAALSGCSGTMPTQSSSGESGVTVFGTIDTSVSHTR
ncbi:hypothetical protein GCM10010975_06780 [Comamonas phosphati]|nr:hypothetical protein GCM10010975_06780 [Comamonas phosphati]